LGNWGQWHETSRFKVISEGQFKSWLQTWRGWVRDVDESAGELSHELRPFRGSVSEHLVISASDVEEYRSNLVTFGDTVAELDLDAPLFVAAYFADAKTPRFVAAVGQLASESACSLEAVAWEPFAWETNSAQEPDETRADAFRKMKAWLLRDQNFQYMLPLDSGPEVALWQSGGYSP
jgi:hypothetical protein